MSRIFLISPLESPFLARGTRSVELARLLSDAGENLCFVTSNFNHERKKCYSPDEVKSAFDSFNFDSEIISVPSYSKNISLARVFMHIVFCVKLFFFLFNNANKNDCIVTMLSFPELTLVDYLIGRLKKVKTVLDVWDIWPDAFPFKKTIAFRLFSIYCNKIYSLTLKSYSEIVYVAPSFLRWINRFSSSKRAKFIPLGFDRQRWTFDLVTRSPSKLNSVNILYIGYLSYQFDISLVIAAVNYNPSLMFHVVGDGELLTHYKSLSKSNNIIFYGRRDPSFVVTTAKSCSIAVLHIADGAAAFMPNKLFDYIGAGLPILSIGFNDSSNFICDLGIGWVIDPCQSAVDEFFKKISPAEIALKSLRMREISVDYSKDTLYVGYVKLVRGE